MISFCNIVHTFQIENGVVYFIFLNIFECKINLDVCVSVCVFSS
jgi:hypothetical protein